MQKTPPPKKPRPLAKVLDLRPKLAEKAAQQAAHTGNDIELTDDSGASNVISLASRRAKWRPILKLDLGEEGEALHVFHDHVSRTLELIMLGYLVDGEAVQSIRHVLSPTSALRLLTAISEAYGYGPKGPEGAGDDDGPGPACA